MLENERGASSPRGQEPVVENYENENVVGCLFSFTTRRERGRPQGYLYSGPCHSIISGVQKQKKKKKKKKGLSGTRGMCAKKRHWKWSNSLVLAREEHL